MAESIANKSPLIIKLAKETINRGMNPDLAAGLSYEKLAFTPALLLRITKMKYNLEE